MTHYTKAAWDLVPVLIPIPYDEVGFVVSPVGGARVDVAAQFLKGGVLMWLYEFRDLPIGASFTLNLTGIVGLGDNLLDEYDEIRLHLPDPGSDFAFVSLVYHGQAIERHRKPWAPPCTITHRIDAEGKIAIRGAHDLFATVR